MNTDDIERRLEAFASSSANLDVPAALWNKLAELEASGSAAAKPTPIRFHTRYRRGGAARTRGLMLIGLAACLSMIGGVLYVAASHVPQQTTAPSNRPTATGIPNSPVPTSGIAQPLPTPPVSLGAWTQIHTFVSPIKQYSSLTLSWQQNQFVGIAYGIDEFGFKENCVLRSADASTWTCNLLPRPKGIDCLPDVCVMASGVAVKNGHWLAVGQVEPWPSAPSASDPAGPHTLLTWTSDDGVTWLEQPTARLIGDFSLPLGPTLMATNAGFLMAGGGGPAIWTTIDGKSWRPARYKAGSSPMLDAVVSADQSGKLLALGNCPVDGQDRPRPCAATTSDGVSWTTSLVATGVTSALSIFSERAAKADGRWVVYLVNRDDYKPGDPVFYRASSEDGGVWTLAPVAEPNIYRPGLAMSLPGASGRWAIAGPMPPIRLEPSSSPHYEDIPDFVPSTYWSDLGLYWQEVAGTPPGLPMALVETPTELVAFMSVRPSSDSAAVPSVSVWTAAKR